MQTRRMFKRIEVLKKDGGQLRNYMKIHEISNFYEFE